MVCGATGMGLLRTGRRPVASISALDADSVHWVSRLAHRRLAIAPEADYFTRYASCDGAVRGQPRTHCVHARRRVGNRGNRARRHFATLPTLAGFLAPP